jgi:putative hydrolase of the HAD superfamily
MKPEPTGLEERLQPLPEIRAVLFDVYGTLFISGSGDISIAHELNNAEALKAALADTGYSGNLEQAAEIGLRRLEREIQAFHELRRSAGISHPEVNIEQIWATILNDMWRAEMIVGDVHPASIRKVAVNFECRVNPVWPMPGAAGLLRALRQRNLRLGIVSNAQFYTPLLFEAFLDGKTVKDLGFDKDLCRYSYVQLEAKPSTRLFTPALTHLYNHHGVAASEVLYVGNDCLNDILPASQLGCRTALFAGDQRSLRLRQDDARCRGLAPDLILTGLKQLLEVLPDGG